MHKIYLFSLTGMNYGNANTLGLEQTGEKAAISFILNKTAANSDFIFFDVGANTGEYSKLIAGMINENKVKIYAFEPVKQTFSLLLDNTTAVKQMSCFNIALGDKEEALTIYSNHEASGATTFYNKALENYSFNKNLSEVISVKTLDDFCNNAGIKSIDFIKIDVEGHELKVLQGAKKLLQDKKITFIQFEFGPFNVYSQTWFKDFWELLSPSYTIFRLISDGLFEIKSYSENLEIYRTANFLAELK